MSAPLRLRLDGQALVDNWRALDRLSGSAVCGAAVKADGYGLGAREVATRLMFAGCRDFFVATWDEAEALGPLPRGVSVSVLHGARAEDMAVALRSSARPVLNTAAQIARWRETERPCDVMVDTGMNRLGVSVDDVSGGLLDELPIETLMSHLACADEDSVMNRRQRDAFAGLAGQTSARRMSLANSAGVALGSDYAFDLTRPGLALYGGVPRHEMAEQIGQVAFIEAQILQRRRVAAGDSVGYNATWIAPAPTEVAILNIGYADGYPTALSNKATCGDGRFPVLGRVSMDLLAIDVTQSDVGEGDWVSVDYDLATASRLTGRSQYELLTGLGARFRRHWQ